MRYFTVPICLILTVLTTGSVWADEESAKNEDRGDRRAEMRRKIMEEFDADGDGELSDDERAKAREEMRGRRGERGKERAGKPGGEGRERARRDRPEGRRGGPGGPPDPAKLFDKFDADGSGSLSRDEFKRLVAEMRPPRGPDGPRGERPDGPPPEGRRRFERNQPLQNPGERGERPPRPEGRRRLNDEDGSAKRGPRRGEGRRGGEQGAGGRGPGGPPNPDAVFDRFDANDDGELSKDEFMKLADRMRQMHERRGRGGQGMREGRGPGRGGRGGDDDGPRRRRPARPEFDDDVSVAPSDDNSV